MSDRLAEASDGRERLEIHEVVANLLDRLGRSSVAYIAGSRNRALPGRWATPPDDSTHAEPSHDQARRLQAADSILRSIGDAEGVQVAQGWLLAANPRLDGSAPLELIRNDDHPAVFRAAEAFINDIYHS
jgi:hypothetical protein